jgi:hypothetical protein
MPPRRNKFTGAFEATTKKANGGAAAETVVPSSAPPPLADNAELEANYQTIREFYNSRASDDAVVMILRHTESGHAEFVAQGSPAVIDEPWIQSRFGGGRYIFRLRTPEGEYLAQSTVFIAAPAATAANCVSSPADGGTAAGANLQIDLLREQLARQQEMMLHLIDRPAPAAAPAGAGGNLLQVVQAVASLRELASPQSQIQGVIDALSEGLKLGMKQSTPPDTTDRISSVLKIVDKVGEMLPRVIGPPGAPPPQGTSPVHAAPSSAPGTPSPAAAPDLQKEMLGNAVRYLKTRIGRDPGIWADWILENLDDPNWAPLAALIEKPFEEIAVYIGDDDLNREPYKSWFARLLAELKNGLTSSDSDGAPRND